MGAERAKLFLAKARGDEILIEEIISKERIWDELIGFHAQQAAKNSERMPRPISNVVSIERSSFHPVTRTDIVECGYRHCF